ncbi:MAG: amino acid permease [Proteobacteria bacterium]|nr:amino acid permease [Pseudomonadota bacterium]
MGIGSRKSLDSCLEDAFAEKSSRLRRSLGVVSLTAFGVGCTVGAGIFSLTGDIAAHSAGPAVSLSYLLASVACFFAGLCYAEFAAMVPLSGSAYSYAYVTLGELVAWVIGWSLVLEWGLAASVVAVSWSGYTQSALRDLGFTLPAVFAQAPFARDAHDHLVRTGAWFDLPAVAVTLACTALPLLGMRTSAAVNGIIVIAKVFALVVLVVVGARFVHPANWHPFIPPNQGGFAFGWTGVLSGAGTLFFAYIGFDGVATLAEEARDPQRTLPLSLFASLLICTVLYVAVSIVITGLAPYPSLAVADPLYYALSSAHAQLGPVKALIAVVAIFGLISVVLASIVGQARIFYSMARDGLLPPAFERLGARTQTPITGTVVTGLLAAVVAGLVPLSILGELVSLGTLLAFAIVCLGVMVLRRIAPEARRPFRTPWVPLVPILGFLCCAVLMAFLPLSTWVRFALWLALGLLIYYRYGHRNSRLRSA